MSKCHIVGNLVSLLKFLLLDSLIPQVAVDYVNRKIRKIIIGPAILIVLFSYACVHVVMKCEIAN